jgi:broad specificity phosphatase PhoE
VAEWAREIHCGEIEGIPLDGLQREHPALWARNQAQVDDGFAWPGGESYRDFRARVVAGLTGIAEAHAGERIAVVTHAGAITQIVGVARGRSAAVWSKDRPDPLGAIECTWRNGGPVGIITYRGQDWF